MGPMDRIRTHKNMQRKAELDQGLRDILGKLSREKLRNIPESRLNGIHALPVELWSQIIKHVLDLCFQPRRRRCRDVFRVLRLRFVCRAFDEEIRRALHQRLDLNQLPYYLFLAYNIETSDTSLRNAFLASALYRETQRCSENGAIHPIAYRIKNCVLVAQHLLFDHNAQQEQQLYKRFCTSASASYCCREYIFDFRCGFREPVLGVDNPGGFAREGDILLEVSLLVANGYQLTKVKQWMVRLGRLGLLAGYREYAIPRRIVGVSRPVCGFVFDGLCTLGSHESVSEEEIAEAITQPSSSNMWEREIDQELEEIERQML
ncbi:unnamed protein product [Alternaria alternata]